MEFQQVELQPNPKSFPKFLSGDPEKRGNGWFRSGIDHIDRPWKPLAVGQRFDGLSIFSGGHGTLRFDFFLRKASSIVFTQ